MSKLFRKRAQTTAEYAVLIAIVVGAVVAMQVYVRRGMQARIKAVVDDTNLGGALPATYGGRSANLFGASANQYEPYYLAQNTQTGQTSDESENLEIGGSVSRATRTDSTSNSEAEQGWRGWNRN
jgi:hypothetical protein